MELKISEGRVYGSRYYTVEVVTGLFSREKLIKIDDVKNWVTEAFGSTSAKSILEPGSRWYYTYDTFWFRNQKDLTLFVLRWS
jgi:hypothetical protein